MRDAWGMARPKNPAATDENVSRWHDDSVMGYDRHPDYQGGRLGGESEGGAPLDLPGLDAFSRFRVACIQFLGSDNPDLVAWATDPALTFEASRIRLEILGTVAELSHKMLDLAGGTWTEASDLLDRVRELSNAWDDRRQPQGRSSDLRAMVAHTERLASVLWRCRLEAQRGVQNPEEQHARRMLEHMLHRSCLPDPLGSVTADEWLKLATAWGAPILRNDPGQNRAPGAWRLLHEIATAGERRITSASSWKSTRDMYRREIAAGEKRKPTGAIG